MEHHHINYQKVSRETFTAVDQLIEKYRSPLESYLDRLFWWNERVNLVSRDVSRGTVWEHIRHSLILTQFPVYRKADHVVDAGTGGGLPGIPLAIVSPEKSFILNDIVSKKVMAIRQILINLELENALSKTGSVQEIPIPSSSLLISKHAFKIDELWNMTHDKPWNTAVFYKGIDFQQELKSIDTPLEVDCFSLSRGPDFYDGKGLVIIKR